MQYSRTVKEIIREMDVCGMTPEEEEWIKHALVEADRRRCISKVLRMESSDAVPVGNNFVSDIYRLKVKVMRNSGDIDQKNVIYKILPTSKNKMPGAKDSGVFKVEARTYMETLREMEKLIRGKEPAAEIFWPEFYAVQGNYDGLLMEDLTPYGYKMLNRREGLDYDQCGLCMNYIGKFHALAAVLKEKSELSEKDYRNESFFFYNRYTTAKIQKEVADTIAGEIEKKWPEEWREYGEGLRNYKETVMSRLEEIYKEDTKDIFMTLNHGDFWMNNVMFQSDSFGKPISLRIIDFQLCFWNSPCFDIHHMFMTSLRLEFFDRRLDLLRLYYDALADNLTLYGYTKDIPTYEQLEKDYERTKIYAYALGLMMRPFFMNPPLHELLEMFPVETEEEKRALPYKYEGEEFLKTIRQILREMKELGFLGLT